MSDIENLTGSAYDDNLTGNGLANLLIGGAGDDTLNGAAGADTMKGGAGNDNYFVDDAGDLVIDSNGGIDSVRSSITYTLTPNVENLTLTGAGDLDGTGNSANNRIEGNSGNNVIFGGNGNDQLYARGGTDQLSGGAGDDRLFFEDNLDQGDVVTGGTGSDTLMLAGNYSNFVFLATTMTEVEYIRLTAGSSYRLTTNDATVADGTTLTVEADTLGAGDTLYFDGSAEGTAGSRFIITAGAGDDTLAGGAGGDHLLGGNGSDLLIGYSGDDFLTGGRRADRLELGFGNDTAVYGDALESTGGSYDTIAGFDGGADFFDLPTAVTGVDPTIASGRLTEGNFNQDLAAVANTTTLLAQHAVLFTPDAGAHAGETFLVVDANGVAGYQAREDFVFRLENAGDVGSLSTDRFV